MNRLISVKSYLILQYSNSANTSDAEEKSSKGFLRNKGTTGSSTVQAGMLFEKFQSFCHPETSKVELSKCLDASK